MRGEKDKESVVPPSSDGPPRICGLQLLGLK